MSNTAAGLVFAEDEDNYVAPRVDDGQRWAHEDDRISNARMVADSRQPQGKVMLRQQGQVQGHDHGEDTGVVEVSDHACRYCGVDDPAEVVRCLESNMWFCNGSGATTASHIIHHLVRSKNKEVCLHPDGPLEDTIVECYNCASRNAFTMGFLPAKGETMMVLLCRTCLSKQDLKDLGWNMDKWTPLITDRQFVEWLVKVPEENETALSITTAQIIRLEEMWKKNPKASLRDLDNHGQDGTGDGGFVAEEDDVMPVLDTYEDGFHYREVFNPLVHLEAEYDKEMKSAMREDNVSLRWKTSEISGRVSAVVNFTPVMSETLRLTIGDELKLTLSKSLMPSSTAHKELMIMAPSASKKGSDGKGRAIMVAAGGKKKDWECTGTIIHISDINHEITIELRSKESVPLHVNSGFGLEFVWRAITFDRMHYALKKFAIDDDCVDGYIYHKLMGHDVQETRIETKLPARFNVKGLPELNESQTKAIREVLTRPLALIQGPPGTGKTFTSASLVYHMVQAAHNDSVLVCAPSNVAVDHLAKKIHQTGLKVVRLSAKNREHFDSNIDDLTLHHIVQSLVDKGCSPNLKRLIDKKERSGNQLSSRDMAQLTRLRRKLEDEVLKTADVICCTCSGAGDPRLAKRKFRRVLLDEATQATEPESLIPLVMGCKQFVLVGDHCQLGPVVMFKKAANAGLNSSLFERLVTVGLRPIRLTVQYRMHPGLSEFPSNTFYEGSLQNGVSESERTDPTVVFPWPKKSKPMMFFACTGAEELYSTGTSYLNRSEASTCEKVVSALLKGGARPSQIGVVTPYEGQRSYICTQLSINLKQEDCNEIEVSSVDAFQGREKDYIILSCVRSNEKQGIGFLNDPRRLNVALTRAKFGIVVLGNPRVLAKRPLWNTLLNYFQEHDLLVEGTVNKLVPLKMKFPTTRKFFRDRRQRLFDERASLAFSGDSTNPYGDGGGKYGGELSAMDSRHDVKYGGETHRQQQQMYGNQFDFLTGPTVRMPNIPMPGGAPTHPYQVPQQQMPRYRSYGDYDYQFRGGKNTQEQERIATQVSNNGGSATQGMMTQAAFAQASQTQQPFTQTRDLASQSQQFLTTQQPQSLTQSTTQADEYQFQDDDDE